MLICTIGDTQFAITKLQDAEALLRILVDAKPVKTQAVYYPRHRELVTHNPDTVCLTVAVHTGEILTEAQLADALAEADRCRDAERSKLGLAA